MSSAVRAPQVYLLRGNHDSRDPRLRNEVRSLAEAGYAVTVIAWDREGISPAREEKEDHAVIRYQRSAPYTSKKLFLLMPLWFLFIFRTLMSRRVDVIHACDFDTVMPALAVKWLKGSKVVYDIYDFYTAKTQTIPRGMVGLFRAAEQWCARRSDAVVMVDEARLYQLGNRPPKRVVVAMNCPYDRVDPAWRKPEGQPFTVFYAGLIAENRGIPKLIQVTRDIANIRVIIAGHVRDDQSRRALESAEHCEYLGAIDHDRALKLTYEADAVYSYYDPSWEINRTANSQKMYEAFMCSTAVIANSGPPSARVIEEHECGALLPYEDDAGLRQTLEQWRDHREIPREMGRNGRRLFERELNWPRMAEHILRVYEELLGR